MPKRGPKRILRWQATAIFTLFFCAVAGAAAIGWWYARESPPHQGPIVLISVDGLSAKPASPTTAAAPAVATPAIDALAADSVTFDRAYTHSPLALPAHASLLSGRLPFEHGVRDDAGYRLAPTTRTLADLLRHRGFKTAAAVSTFVLRDGTGLSQGFSTFANAEMEPLAAELYLLPLASRPPYLLADDSAGDPLAAALVARRDRANASALAHAEEWARAQQGQRYFLMLQVDAAHAEAAVSGVTALLRKESLYDQATIIMIGARGRAGAAAALDDATLHVPFLIKQPHREGAGRHVAVPVQHIDLVPTVLDFVRAPVPPELKGRSLKPLLSDDKGRIVPQPIYAESLAPYLRFGGHPLFALTVNGSRYVRGVNEEIVKLEPAVATDAAAAGARSTAGRPTSAVPAAASGARTDAAASSIGASPEAPDPDADAITPLRATLDRYLAGHATAAPSPIADAEREWLALDGYLAGLPPMPGAADVHLADAAAQRVLAEQHQRAAVLSGQRRFAAAVQVLQRSVHDQPGLASVHYQIGTLTAALGRIDEALNALSAAAMLRPDLPQIPAAMASVYLTAGRFGDAQVQAQLAVDLAAPFGPEPLSAAHQMAARVALAAHSRDIALEHADAAQAASPAIPMRALVEGRLLVEQGQYEGAATLLREAAAMLAQHDMALDGLNLTLAQALAGLGQNADAEAAYLAELRAFPGSIDTYAGLAALAHAAGDDARVEDLMNQLLSVSPTPDGYAAAARLWTAVGERKRAEAIRSDARSRFRLDPQLATRGSDTPR